MSIRLFIAGMALLLLLAPGAVAQTETAPAPAPPAEAEALPACGDCHELAQAFVHNPHAKGQVENGAVPNGVCETCHGDGKEHIEAGGDPTRIVVPRGRKGGDETCMLCHDSETQRRTHKTGVHANSNAVNCFSCHSIHGHQQQPLLARPEPQLCSTCHTQAASFRNKPYTHRMGRAGLSCSTCHEAHGRPGSENLRRTASGDLPCADCHKSQRGPHVFAHAGASVGDCTTCHEPHGSSNPKQLKRATVRQLCLECHSALTTEVAGSQPPAFHNLNSPRYQNCTTCHVAIHGSNRNPALLK